MTAGETEFPEPPADFGRHNMVAFGRGHLFLSHLPMFMAPHDAQLVLECVLVDDGATSIDAWTSERRDHPDQSLYTIFPAKFSLSSLYTPDPPARSSFKATFFRGHLERGGEAIPELTNVTVHVTAVVYARRFDRGGKSDDLNYFLVGRQGEWYLVHTIGAAPDFDQILEIDLAGHEPDEDELARGVEIALPGRPNRAENRIRDGESAMVRGHVVGAHQYLHLEANGASEIYFEEGELASARGAFEPTPLEIEAGFGT